MSCIWGVVLWDIRGTAWFDHFHREHFTTNNYELRNGMVDMNDN